MARKPGEKLPTNPEELSPLTKAAILLLAVGPDRAGKLLKVLEAEAVEEVTRELAAIGRVPSELQNAVVEEFYQITVASGYAAEGGLDYAKQILMSSMEGKAAERVLAQIQTQVQKTPFSFLQRAESDNLLTFIQDEHPQTIALILCHLAHHKAAEILVGLPMQKQIEVIKRMANMEQTNPEVIKEVEKGLESRLANMLVQSMEKAGGVPTVSTPPARSMLCVSMLASRLSRPRSTSLMTSGLVCSMLAMRLMTSICFCMGSPTRISLALW